MPSDPFTPAELTAGAKHLRRTFGDEPIALGENGWKRLIETALNAIADERASRIPTTTEESS